MVEAEAPRSKSGRSPASLRTRGETGSARSGLSAEHLSRCGPRRAENGRAGLTNQRTPTERRAPVQPIRATLEGKGRELEKLA